MFVTNLDSDLVRRGFLSFPRHFEFINCKQYKLVAVLTGVVTRVLNN